MKVHEIQDGIVLITKDLELNERSKLLDDSFLDLCKPLIQRSSKNTVDFVHFSAKEFVPKPTSIDLPNSNTDIFSVAQAPSTKRGLSSTTRKHNIVWPSLA